jgi:hypothetical protein
VDEKLYLNEENFASFLDKNHLIIHSKIALFVFTNLEKDCVSCLYEGGEWAAPLYQYSPDVYELFLCIPESCSTSIVDSFLAETGIPENMVYLIPNKHFLPFNRYGVLKVLLTSGHNLHWYELGNSGEEEQRRFTKNLLKTIDRFK